MSNQPPRFQYQQIAGEIETSIVRGDYRHAGRLPSERRLMSVYGVQRNTVRQALTLLERDGKIESVGKSGWFVSKDGSVEGEAALSSKRVLLVTFRRDSSASLEALTVGLQETLASRGVQILRYDSPGVEQAAHVASIQQLTSVDAGGIVMWPHSTLDASLLSRLQALTPLILLDRRVFGFESDSVTFDDFGGGRVVTEHLLAQGHRRIAFLGDEPFVESVQSRWLGYRKALEDSGIAPQDNLTVLTYGQHEPTFSNHVRFLVRGLPEPPTAIVCSNDVVASKLLLILKTDGLRVPEDIAVTGFGNEATSYLDLMGLTTVEQPFEELGRSAGILLLRRLSEPQMMRDRRHHQDVRVPMHLVARSSSGPHVDPLL